MRADEGLDTAPTAPDAGASADLMRRVLSDMLEEAMDLMEATEALAARGGRRRGPGATRDPLGAATALRLSTRLAAVGGWIVGHGVATDGETDADPIATPPHGEDWDVEPLAADEPRPERRDAEATRARLRESLRRAAFAPLDPARFGGELADVVARTEALLARAVRLDAQLGGASATPRRRV